MTSKEAYLKFLIKINKGSTQFNATVDRSVFCSLYNESQRRWLNKNTPEVTTDETNNVQSIIVNATLSPLTVKKEYVEFDLPKDWFACADTYILANKSKCKKKVVNLYQTKSINIRKLLADDSTKPSFDFQESFYTLEHDKIKVYKEDFDIVELSFNYYKEPKNIEIAGGVKPDGTPMIDVDPELADIFVDQIISETATEYMRNWENAQGVQLGKDRSNSEN
jgi:hypothetical protein